MFHKRLLKEFKDIQNRIVGMVIAQWCMLLANAMLLFTAAEFISASLQGGRVKELTVRLITVLLGALVIRQGMSVLNSRLSFQVSKQVKERLRILIYEKLMRTGKSYRKYLKTSEAVQLSTEGVEQLEIYFGKYIPQFFYSMLAPISLFFVVAAISIKVAVVLLLCVPLIPVSIVAVQKFAKRMLAKYWGIYTELGDSFLECLQGLTTLKIYQAEERYAARMDEEAERFRKVTMRVLIMQLNSISIMDLIAYGGAGIGIILSILEFKSGNVNAAQCFFMIMISAEFFLPLRLLGSFFHIAMNGNAAADKIFRLLDMEESSFGKEAGGKKHKGHTVTLSDVTFSYEKDRPVLKEINIQAGPGITAFVGKSGCGKSTIISLVMGELVPEQGRIKLGNCDISNILPDMLRRTVTKIGHDSYLFTGTVRENLLMGKKDASEEEMYGALKLVKLLDYIQNNGGLDYAIEERAANLSGGQKQRLAIARALLHDTDIYIFNEAASNVDAESENDIMEVIQYLSKTKTVLFVSHRLANVTEADFIYVLKDGQIAEAGSHRELERRGGYYHTLYTQQMRLEHYRKEELAYE